MAVQFNLLPDVKLEFNRQKRAKHVVYTFSTIAIIAVVSLVVLSFFIVNVLQKKLLNDAKNDIQTYSQKLKSVPDLDKVLTVQNQLTSLPGLHQKKPITSRIFLYLPQVTPTKVNIGKIALDITNSKITLSGTADSVKSVNLFVDTLKFTQFQSDKSTDKKNAFTNVVLTKVDRNNTQTTYTIDTVFDPALFDATQNIKLVVPNETTTRSVLNAPGANSALFNGKTGEEDNQQGGQ